MSEFLESMVQKRQSKGSCGREAPAASEAKRSEPEALKLHTRQTQKLHTRQTLKLHTRQAITLHKTDANNKHNTCNN